MTERIAKVGFKDGLVVVQTSRVVTGDHEKQTTTKLYREPHVDFLAAFSALESHVRDILEWPSSLYKERIKITGVSWSLSESTDVEGAVITGQAALDGADAPLCFNTPHLPFDQYSEGGCAKLMPEDAVDALELVRAEARKFLDGKSSQGDLFDGKSAAAGEGREETTISINGGPPAPMSVVKQALKIVKDADAANQNEAT